MNIVSHIKAFLQDEEGASGIEYALVAALVAGIIATLVADTNGIGARVNRILTGIKNALPAQ